MSKARANDLRKMRDELQKKFAEACEKLAATIADEEEDNPAKKQAAIDYSGARVAREIALKAGEGRKGTQAGVFAIRMLGGKRGGPPEE
jgi:hypothetical protein